MNKTKITVVVILFSIITAIFAVTNITVNIPIPEWQYTNMFNVASNQNKTVEQFFKDKILDEVKDQQLSILIELWTNATPEQQQAALNALRTIP